VGNYSELDIAFPSAKTGTYGFNLTSVYSGLLSFNSTANNFAFAFQPFPLTDGTYNVTSAQLSVKTGDWSSPKTSFVNGTFASAAFTSQTTRLKPYNTTVATMIFSSTTQSILDVTANRTITLSQTGAIQVIDFYNMTNRGNDLIHINIFDGSNNLVHSENVAIDGDFGKVYNLTAVSGVPTFEVTDKTGNIINK